MIKLSILIILQYNFFLRLKTPIRLKKCVIKLSIDAFLHLFIFLVDKKTQGMCDRVVSEDTFSIFYCPDKYKIQRMYDEAVDDCLAALKFITDWFVTSKIIKKLLTASCADDNILYFNEDSGDVIFSCNEIGILSSDLKC